MWITSGELLVFAIYGDGDDDKFRKYKIGKIFGLNIFTKILIFNKTAVKKNYENVWKIC